MFRSRALLDLARGQPCQMRVPGICCGDPATVVSAHSNQERHGHGRGLKAHDCFTADACAACHAWLDSGTASREAKAAAFQLGFERTLLARFQSGAITVAGSRARADQPIPIPKILPRPQRRV